MSVWGSVIRRLTVLDLEFKRTIPEDRSDVLTPGWHLNITLPLVDVYVGSFGWRESWTSRLKRLRSPKDAVILDPQYIMALGYEIGWNTNGNDGHAFVTGDASPTLIGEKSEPWQMTTDHSHPVLGE